jgi:hypothetical protein
MCRTQQIHATQIFFFAGHFISRQFSFLLFKNVARTAKFIPLNNGGKKKKKKKKKKKSYKAGQSPSPKTHVITGKRRK